MLDGAVAYQALTARDPRFDGVFFVGVTTTGIYCRPICPARTPAPARCEVFATPVLVAGAARRIAEGALNEQSLDDLAAELGVTARHLRRVLEAKLGVSPVEL